MAGGGRQRLAPLLRMLQDEHEHAVVDDRLGDRLGGRERFGKLRLALAHN